LRAQNEITLPLAGGETFRAGRWEAQLGEQPIHGFYSLIITTQNGQELVREETANVTPSSNRR